MKHLAIAAFALFAAIFGPNSVSAEDLIYRSTSGIGVEKCGDQGVGVELMVFKHQGTTLTGFRCRKGTREHMFSVTRNDGTGYKRGIGTHGEMLRRARQLAEIYPKKLASDRKSHAHHKR